MNIKKLCAKIFSLFKEPDLETIMKPYRSGLDTLMDLTTVAHSSPDLIHVMQLPETFNEPECDSPLTKTQSFIYFVDKIRCLDVTVVVEQNGRVKCTDLCSPLVVDKNKHQDILRGAYASIKAAYATFLENLKQVSDAAEVKSKPVILPIPECFDGERFSHSWSINIESPRHYFHDLREVVEHIRNHKEYYAKAGRSMREILAIQGLLLLEKDTLYASFAFSLQSDRPVIFTLENKHSALMMTHLSVEDCKSQVAAITAERLEDWYIVVHQFANHYTIQGLPQ